MTAIDEGRLCAPDVEAARRDNRGRKSREA
jgi:hypothetical protein